MKDAKKTSPGLSLASHTWMGVNAVARSIYRVGFLKERRLQSYVIGVGNIQAGGSGKTPLVALIAQEAVQKQIKSICILTRGYGGVWEKSGGIIEPGGLPADPHLTGDEAALLHELCPFVTIGIGANRIQQFEKIVRLRNGAYPDLVILDDAFQHWKIHQDVKLVALTGFQPNEILFREGYSALRDADLIVWTKGKSVQQKIKVKKPWVKVNYDLPIPESLDQNYLLVTGVANGELVLELAKKAQYRILDHFCFEDHMKYDCALIDSLFVQAQKLKCRIALTGKDWVKWKSLGVLVDQVCVLEPQVFFEEGRIQWETVLWRDHVR